MPFAVLHFAFADDNLAEFHVGQQPLRNSRYGHV